MQADISMCFHECLPEKLCLSAATIANDLDFLFSVFWLLTVGQVTAVLCLRAGKSCWVGCDSLLLLTKFVYGSVPFCRIVWNWHMDTRVNSQHGYDLRIVIELMNSHKAWCLQLGTGHSCLPSCIALLLERGSAVADDVGGKGTASALVTTAMFPTFLALLNDFMVRLSYSLDRVIYTLCDSAAFWGMAACLPEKQTLWCHSCVVSSLKYSSHDVRSVVGSAISTKTVMKRKKITCGNCFMIIITWKIDKIDLLFVFSFLVSITKGLLLQED